MLIQITPRWGSAAAGAAGDNGSHGARPVLRVSGPSVRVDPVTVRAATIADMREVEPLIRAFANDHLMLPRSFDQLARAFREFRVAVDESGRVIGCGALRIYTEELAEVCSLAVDESHQRNGIGRMLVDQLVDDARTLKIGTVFALTLEPGFFARLGFHVVAKEEFPLKVWADCRSCPKLLACDEIAVARKL